MDQYSIEVRAVPESLGEVAAFLERALRAVTASEEQFWNLYQAIEELVTNVVFYAYVGEPGPVSVTVTKEESAVVICIADQGRPFDPTREPPPDLSVPHPQRRVGGLGIHLVRELVDQMSYRREGQTNCLTLRARLV
jgi:serine/threonine-protein kinase RsbW